jgi:hypothetical protein
MGVGCWFDPYKQLTVRYTPRQLDAQGAAAEIAAGRERIDAAEVVERELSAELTALVDRFPDYHVRQAEELSQAAQEAIAAASEAAQVAAQAWQAAYGAWGVVRTSRGRRNLDLSPGVPVSDLGRAVHELSAAITTPWRAALASSGKPGARERVPHPRPVHPLANRCSHEPGRGEIAGAGSTARCVGVESADGRRPRPAERRRDRRRRCHSGGSRSGAGAKQTVPPLDAKGGCAPERRNPLPHPLDTTLEEPCRAAGINLRPVC